MNVTQNLMNICFTEMKLRVSPFTLPPTTKTQIIPSWKLIKSEEQSTQTKPFKFIKSQRELSSKMTTTTMTPTTTANAVVWMHAREMFWYFGEIESTHKLDKHFYTTTIPFYSGANVLTSKKNGGASAPHSFSLYLPLPLTVCQCSRV